MAAHTNLRLRLIIAVAIAFGVVLTYTSGVFSACSDAVVDANESCDLGSLNNDTDPMSWCSTTCTATHHHPQYRYVWHRHPYAAELSLADHSPSSALSFERGTKSKLCVSTTEFSADYSLVLTAQPYGQEVCRLLFNIPDNLGDTAPMILADLYYGKPVNTNKTDWTQDPPTVRAEIDLYSHQGKRLEPLGDNAFHYWRQFDSSYDQINWITTTRFFNHRIELRWGSLTEYLGPLFCVRLDCILESDTSFCGDGIVQSDHETCDDGMNNWPGHDPAAAHYCSNTCAIV